MKTTICILFLMGGLTWGPASMAIKSNMSASSFDKCFEPLEQQCAEKYDKCKDEAGNDPETLIRCVIDDEGCFDSADRVCHYITK